MKQHARRIHQPHGIGPTASTRRRCFAGSHSAVGYYRAPQPASEHAGCRSVTSHILPAKDKRRRCSARPQRERAYRPIPRVVLRSVVGSLVLARTGPARNK